MNKDPLKERIDFILWKKFPGYNKDNGEIVPETDMTSFIELKEKLKDLSSKKLVELHAKEYKKYQDSLDKDCFPAATSECYKKFSHFLLSLHEATSILLGISPEKSTYSYIQMLEISYSESPLLQEYLRLRKNLLLISKQHGNNVTSKINIYFAPHDLLKIAEMLKINVAKSYKKLVLSNSSHKRNEKMNKNIDDDKEEKLKTSKEVKNDMNPKEKISLYILVAGLIMVSYKSVPIEGINFAKEISDDLAKNGLEIDEDTVRKYINKLVEEGYLKREPKKK